jgi:hypothetical protein
MEDDLQLRSEKELRFIEDELIQELWYQRHMRFIQLTEIHEFDQAIRQQAAIKAKEFEDKHPEYRRELNDYEFGMLNGKLSMIRWVLGYEMGMLDT